MEVKFLEQKLDSYDIANGVIPSRLFKITEYLSDEFSNLNSMRDISRGLQRLLEVSIQECYDYLIALEIDKEDPNSDVIDFLEKKFDSDFRYINGSLERRGIAEYMVNYEGVLFRILTNEDYTKAIILSVESEKLGMFIEMLN